MILVMLKNAINFYKVENTKSVKQWKIITYQLKTFEKPNTIDIISAITQHPKTSYKLCKFEKVGTSSFLHSVQK